MAGERLAVGATVVLYDGSPFHPDGRCALRSGRARAADRIRNQRQVFVGGRKGGVEPGRDARSIVAANDAFDRLAVGPREFRFRLPGDQAATCACRRSPAAPTSSVASRWAIRSDPSIAANCKCRGLGMKVEIYNEQGQPVRGEKGELVCTAPFPSMPVGFWNDPTGEKYRNAYFSVYPNVWRHGDYAELTEHDGLIIYGRSDAVLNPGGVRIGTARNLSSGRAAARGFGKHRRGTGVAGGRCGSCCSSSCGPVWRWTRA